MYKRILTTPHKTFFLFGPRGTGKSTWLKTQIQANLFLDLLNSSQFLKLSSEPWSLRELIAPLKSGNWVVIDEIQRIPELLNEVHSLYEEKKINFALSESSARKLKRGGANLLAGRALMRHLFPFTHQEFGNQISWNEVIDWGTLPLVVSDTKSRGDTLAAYVETYLREELIQEGIIRKLEPFIRFLRISGILNGQVLNVENIARDAHISRTTVDNYFQILEDTLIGIKLYPFQASLKVKEVSHPKFYFFDSGVARGCAGLLDESIDNVWRGFALETYILHELNAYNHYAQKNRLIYYYRITGSYEIDFLIETRQKTLSQHPQVVCIEVKYSKKWDRRWCDPSKDFEAQSKIDVKARFGVYFGGEILNIQGMQILPIGEFLKRLYQGLVF